jgi:hypothetical protein
MESSTKPKVGPKDFFLWLGAMATLYASVISILTLYFQYIDRLFPDPLQYWVDPYSGAIRFAIATLIVVTPLYIYLTRKLNADVRANPEKKDLWVRRWIIYLTLFVGGLTIAIDAVMLINEFLGGELTTRFLLKALAVFVVVAGFFWYYLSDLKGKWETKVQLAHYLGYGVGVLVLASIVAGFFIIGSPAHLRLVKIDEQKVMDLQMIQSQVIYHYQSKGELPETLAELENPLSGFSVPKDPDGGAYVYNLGDADSFELCATFSVPSAEHTSSPMRGTNDFWGHEAGEQCFARTIDHAMYPLFTEMQKGSPVPIR